MKIKITLPTGSDGDVAKKLESGFMKKYGEDIEFEYVKSDDIIGGFIADIDGDIYDTSISSQLKQMSKHIKG